MLKNILVGQLVRLNPRPDEPVMLDINRAPQQFQVLDVVFEKDNDDGTTFGGWAVIVKNLATGKTEKAPLNAIYSVEIFNNGKYFCDLFFDVRAQITALVQPTKKE